MMVIHLLGWDLMVDLLSLQMHQKKMFALPDNVSAREGALVEPTAVAVQAVKEATYYLVIK